ncbi:site-specific integrase [Reinekea sp. G2M2-21]|uniref:site-specific integrase n=1 Tax=Reinekea sp. G2M2-21 TaxID=2788942 RepID=UPI0018ABE15E|nr:site-specific integrase [Reinekea sp. G2M2-21]
MVNKKYYRAPSESNGAPAFSKSQLKHAVMVARGSGRTPERDAALILFSACTGLRVSEIAQIEVQHIMRENGEYCLEGWIPGEFTKSGRPGPVYVANPKLKEALDEYFLVRINKKHLTTDDHKKYRGLKKTSKVFLTESGRKFAMSKKIREKDIDGKLVSVEYEACDVLERAFKRFYVRAFGENTTFSSHSGRKYFAKILMKLVQKKGEEHARYDDVVTLMRSHNLTAIQPYVAPTQQEIIDELRK